MEKKHILKIFIAILFIISLIILINTFGVYFNAEPVPIEGMASGSLAQKKKDAAIKAYKNKCGGKKNTTSELCNNTKYNDDFFSGTKNCIWTNTNKCVPGNADGRAYDKDVKLDYWYFKGKCYGKNCPTVA
jgi:hypothetical protein